MTNTELAELMQRSPAECHRELVREYGRYVYAIAYNRLRSCGTSEDIEECVSDVFADIFIKCEFDMSSEEDIKYLIGTIAKRKAIMKYRKLNAQQQHTAEADEEEIGRIASDYSMEEQTEATELRRILLDKIEALGEPDSTILIQKFYYNRTSNEIARSVSMTATAVRSRCSRAMDKLRTMLAEAGITRVGG